MIADAVGVRGLHITSMACRTRAGREARFQIRNAGGVAEAAVTTMGDIHRRVRSRTRVVAIRTRAGQGDQSVHVIRTTVSRRLVGMTIETGDRTTRRYNTNDSWCRAVVTGGTGAGAVGGHVMLGTLNQTPVRYVMTVVAGLPVRLVAAHGHGVTMRMAVEVVRRMTLAAIASRGNRSIRCRVVAGGAAVMLLDVRCIDEVRVIHRHGMAGATFCL